MKPNIVKDKLIMVSVFFRGERITAFLNVPKNTKHISPVDIHRLLSRGGIANVRGLTYTLG